MNFLIYQMVEYCLHTEYILLAKSLINNFNLMERAKGLEPRPSRWQRDALPLSYARKFKELYYTISRMVNLNKNVTIDETKFLL